MPAHRHQLSLISAMSYITGTMIGSGIFVSPKGILRNAGSVGLSLIIWILCAILSAVSALNYIELGTSIPESGSEFAYIAYVGWTPIAFSFLWLATVIQSSCSGAVLFKTFGKYITEALSTIPNFPEQHRYLFQEVFGIGLMILLTSLNFFSLRKFAGKLQVVSMFAKVAVLLLITIIGLISIMKGATENLTPPMLFEGSNWSPGKIVLAMYQGLWAYNGFSTLNYGTEEINPDHLGRILTIAVIGGIAICSVVYLLANVAYFSVLSPVEILASDAVATTFIKQTLGLHYSYVMPALVGLLLIGTLNGHLFTWSRFMMAGSRKGMMPTAWSFVHRNGSPRVALFVHTLLAIIFSFFGDVEKLVDWLTVTATFCTLCAISALILIKWKQIPVSDKAVKFPIIWPLLGWLLNFIIFVVPIIDDPLAAAIGMGFFLVSLVIYYLLRQVSTKQKLWLQKVDDMYTQLNEKIFSTSIKRTEVEEEPADAGLSLSQENTFGQPRI